jgi:hypothetical protein
MVTVTGPSGALDFWLDITPAVAPGVVVVPQAARAHLGPAASFVGLSRSERPADDGVDGDQPDKEES